MNTLAAFYNFDWAKISTVLSSIFVFLGSCVFYISSLVSGHNIYRDLNFVLAILVTTIMGFFLFISSPISFIVLFPDIFVTPIPNSRQELLQVLQQLMLDEALAPYLLLAAGAGVSIGCLSAVQFRRLVLEAFRSGGKAYPVVSGAISIL